MYDPEQSLKRYRDLAGDQKLLAKVEERLGKSHPWTQRIELTNDILVSLSRKQNDMDNCFDSKQKEEIRAEMDELIKLAHEALNKP